MTTVLSSTEKILFNQTASNSQAQSKKTQVILSALDNNEAEGLFLLANSTPDDTWDARLFFLKEFASFYAKALCHCSKYQVDCSLSVEITKEELAVFVNKASCLADKTAFDSKNLTRLWQVMNEYVIEAMIKQRLTDFIATYLANWRNVGSICFHLVENKQNEEYPFAFMPTLVSNLTNQADLVYLPLKLAMPKTEQLKYFDFLQPLFNLSQKLNWVQRLLSSGEIYQPSYWSVNQAYLLLKDAEEIKNTGIIVILPDWWKKNTRPKLKFSIGNNTNSALDVQTLLNCDINLVHNDKLLTTAEIAMLSQAENSLVPFRGSWVEADSTKLNKVIEQWDKLKKTTADGISFIEGMRMLAGVNNKYVNADSQFDADDITEWSSYVAGPWLADTLTKLRDPTLLQDLTPKKLAASKLRHYQQLGVNWLYFLTSLGLGACLADDMGLGKSIQIISLLLLAKEFANNSKKCSLLILPASLLANWKNELTKFAPSLTAYFLHPSESSAQELAEISANPSKLQDYDLVLTTYASVWRQEWLLEQSWDKIILDEAQAIKNPTSKQTCAIKQLTSNVRIALTGTPIENSLTDLWSLFDFLLPGLLGSYNSFKKIVNKIEKTEEEKQRTANYGVISNLIQPYILRRLKTDKKIITDLPEKTEVNAYCGLTNVQARMYKKTIKELTVALESSETSAIKRKGMILNYLLKFKQICNHPAQVLANGDYNPKQSGKFARLKELCIEIKQKQEKVLIFTQFKTITKPLAVFLETVFGVPGLVLHGSTAISKRQEIVAEFQSESGPPFMVLSLKAGGTGLNLTAANHVIHFDRWWNPAVENQATDRAFRIGQKANVLVHKFVCSGTIEDNINSLINAKTKLANVILTSNSQTPKLTELTNQEILQLVSLDLSKIQI